MVIVAPLSPWTDARGHRPVPRLHPPPAPALGTPRDSPSCRRAERARRGSRGKGRRASTLLRDTGGPAAASGQALRRCQGCGPIAGLQQRSPPPALPSQGGAEPLPADPPHGSARLGSTWRGSARRQGESPAAPPGPGGEWNGVRCGSSRRAPERCRAGWRGLSGSAGAAAGAGRGAGGGGAALRGRRGQRLPLAGRCLVSPGSGGRARRGAGGRGVGGGAGAGSGGGVLRRSLFRRRGGRSCCGKRSRTSPGGEAPGEGAARSRSPPRRTAQSRRRPEGKVPWEAGPGAMPVRGALCLGLLLLVLPDCSSAQQPSGCPDLCECSEPARTVKCVNRNLTVVPPDLPPYVRSLFITGNLLTHLPAGAFPAQRLPDLAALNLSGNHLQAVEAGALALPALRQLDLSGNALVSLSPQAFGDSGSALEELALRGALRDHGALSGLAALLQAGALRNLSRLDLADNGLLLLPAGMFTALPALRLLDLSNNSLVGLQNVSFQGLGQLQSLNLSNNSLGVLWNSTLAQFRSLPALRHIDLGRNTWVCDCAIEDLVAWLKDSDQVEGKEALTCAYPDKMLGKALLKINSSDLNCSVPIDLPSQLQTSYVFLGIVLALIGAIFLLVLYLNRKGIKKWMHNIRDACRDHMEGYHYRYEINADPRLTNLSSNSDV